VAGITEAIARVAVNAARRSAALKPVAKAAASGKPVFTARQRQMAKFGKDPGPKMRVDGTLGQLDNPDVFFEGTEPAMLRPGQYGRMGEYYGAKNMGPTSTREWKATLEQHHDLDGNPFLVPGGLDETKPFTYYDMMFLQSQAINPNKLDPRMHKILHDRTVLGHQMAGGGDKDSEVYNQLMLGLTSPNQPLTPNLLLMQRMAAKGPEDIQRMAAMGNNLPSDLTRKEMFAGPVKDITSQLGVQAQARGGLGVSGSHNFTMFPKFAKLYQKDPKWFRFRGDLEHGDTDTEKWAAYVERLMTQVKGLSAKTGSFAGVWQAPRDAAISAVDRHMLEIIGDGLFETAEEAAAWHRTVLDKFNKGRKNKVKTLDEMAAAGGIGKITDAKFSYMNSQNKSPVFRLKRTGEINPEVPKHLADEEWIEEPARAHIMGPRYKRGVGVNQDFSKETGQTGLFSSQWYQWDKQRNRLDPHLGIFPSLSKLPRMSMRQMQQVRDTYKEGGYLSMAEKKAAKDGGEVRRTIPPVRPIANPSRLGYFGVPIGVGLGTGGLLGDRKPRRGLRDGAL
jgi:hypothetical protein